MWLCLRHGKREKKVLNLGKIYMRFTIMTWSLEYLKPVLIEDFKDWFMDVTRDLAATHSTEVIMVAWQIWNARNDVLWNGRGKSAANVVLEARSYLNQWLCAQKNRMEPILGLIDQGWDIEHWKKPDTDTVKVNVDGAIFATSNSFGFGFITRGYDGRIIEAVSSRSVGNVSPEIAEAYGIKEALSWIKGKDWHRVLIETDCLVALQGIDNNTQLPSAFGSIVWDCKQLILELGNISLKFVKCSANKAAHYLARSACYNPVRIFSHNSSPLELLNIVMADLI
uniref:RNase H type-1 domain-containing protein n=1 Tax=Cannabis sativa TaxID=3483 RepID=A0A803NRY9_CANSA